MNHPQFVKRTIRNGKIKWDNRYWSPRGDISHIEGRRMVFGTYAPEYNLLGLHSTPELFKHSGDLEDKVGKRLWNEHCILMSTGEKKPLLDDNCGSGCVDGDFVYQSRDIEFWHIEKEKENDN